MDNARRRRLCLLVTPLGERRHLRRVAARRLGLVVLAPLALSLLAPGSPATAQAVQCGEPTSTVRPGSTGEEWRLVGHVNAFRAANGLGRLALHPGLTAKARDWAAHMARDGIIRHSDLRVGVTATAEGAAENVGCDRDVDSLHDAFVHSAVHRRAMEEPSFTQVGVGIAYAPDGELYASELFMAGGGGAVSEAPAAAGTPAATGPPAATASSPGAVAHPSASSPVATGTGGGAGRPAPFAGLTRPLRLLDLRLPAERLGMTARLVAREAAVSADVLAG